MTQLEATKTWEQGAALRVSKDRHARIKRLSEVTGIPIRRLTDRALDVFCAQHADRLEKTAINGASTATSRGEA